MAVKIISGVPGSGKTLYSVYLAKKHFKKENSKLIKIIRLIKLYIYNGFIFIINIFKRIFKKDLISYKLNVYKKYIYDDHGKVNNIYSNFPIYLYSYFDKVDKKIKKVYSNSVSLWDLKGQYSFLPYSLIMIDEVQLYIDSDEYQDKKARENFRPIAKFLQAHRHYGIKDILFISQHPNRVMAKIRNVTNEFLRVKRFIKIPLTNIGLFFGTVYFESDSYGKSTSLDKKFCNYDFKKRFLITNIKKLYSSYDTCYLRVMNQDRPLKKGSFKNKYLDFSELRVVFRDI